MSMQVVTRHVRQFSFLRFPDDTMNKKLFLCYLLTLLNSRKQVFYSILFYSILFYSILFYSILFYSILFYFYSILFLFYSIPFYSIPFLIIDLSCFFSQIRNTQLTSWCIWSSSW